MGTRVFHRNQTLTLWKKDYLGHLKPGQLDGEQMLEKIRQLQNENEYLKRQREILSLVLTSVDPRLC